MQSKLKLDHPTRAVAMATGGAAIAAIAAMFVPTAFWETLTGATGVSEMIPATGAPLGEKARALISFAFGALTLAILTVMLLRKSAAAQHNAFAPTEIEPEWSEPEPVESMFEVDEEKAESGSPFKRLRARIAAFVEASRGAGDITDLEDLPKLRSGDAHPDAPPRRPFSANRDLAEPERVDVVTEVADVEQVEVEWVEPDAAEVEQIIPAAEIDTIAEEVVQADEVAEEPAALVAAPKIDDLAPARAPIAEIASLDEMVSRFETALAERDTQLAHIENLATEIQSSNVQPIRRDIEAPVSSDPARAEVASLRSVDAADSTTDVPQKPESEELDAALRSALETLHRMNARTR